MGTRALLWQLNRVDTPPAMTRREEKAMIAIWVWKCVTFVQHRLSLDRLVQLCGLHLNTLSCTILFLTDPPAFVHTTNDVRGKTAVRDLIPRRWQSRSPPSRHSRSSYPSSLTLHPGSYLCDGQPYFPTYLSLYLW